MSFSLDAPSQEEMNTGGGNFLNQPGTYHAVITQVTEGAGPNGKPIDGFTVGLDVLDGTVSGQEGRTFNLTFFNPKLNSKDGGLFARKKQAAFCIAANLVEPTLLGQKVSIDLQKANGQQIVLKLEKDEQSSEENKTYLQLAYADIWHVDDPRCEAIPKKKAALELIPKALRHGREWFAWIEKKPSGGNSQAKRETATAGAGSSANVNFDDL